MKKYTCPICRKNSKDKFSPFCSDTCANKDLGNWLTGRYVIPGEKITDDSAFDNLELIDTNIKDKLDLS